MFWTNRACEEGEAGGHDNPIAMVVVWLGHSCAQSPHSAKLLVDEGPGRKLGRVINDVPGDRLACEAGELRHQPSVSSAQIESAQALLRIPQGRRPHRQIRLAEQLAAQEARRHTQLCDRLLVHPNETGQELDTTSSADASSPIPAFQHLLLREVVRSRGGPRRERIFRAKMRLARESSPSASREPQSRGVGPGEILQLTHLQAGAPRAIGIAGANIALPPTPKRQDAP